MAGAAALATVLGYACGGGGGGGTPTTPSPTPSPGTGGGTSDTPTITITTAGVNPKQVEIGLGGRVRFVNNDTRSHDMQSDPHPDHTDCPAMAQVGFIQPGQSKETGNFTTARSCGFHDHNDDRNASLLGTIVIR
jgi:hypothetical protein